MPTHNSILEDSHEPPFKNTNLVRFWTLIGRFSMRFARVELFLFHVFSVEAGLPPNIMNSVLSGDGSDTIMSKIRRLWAAKKKPPEETEYVNRALSQLKELLNFRNKLFHYGLNFEGNTGFISSQLKAHTIENVSIVYVSEETFNAADADLSTIESTFLLYTMIETGDKMTGEFLDRLRNNASSPWQYKSSKQDFHIQKPPKEKKHQGKRRE